MKTVSLSGSLREGVGKKDAKKQRREGKVPCVLYGGEEQVHFTLENMDFEKLIFTPEVYVVNLTIDGNAYQAILQDVQYHPVSDMTLHADFLLVKEGRPITIMLPVRFEGNVPGVIAGGRLIKKARKIKVRGLVEDLPDYVMIDMSKMKIGDNIKVSSLPREKYDLLDNPNNVLVLVKSARVLVADEEDEEGEEGEEGAEGGEGTEEASSES